MNRLEFDLVNSPMVLVNKFYTMFRKYRKYYSMRKPIVKIYLGNRKV